MFCDRKTALVFVSIVYISVREGYTTLAVLERTTRYGYRQEVPVAGNDEGRPTESPWRTDSDNLYSPQSVGMLLLQSLG